MCPNPACRRRPPWTSHPPTVRACRWPLRGSCLWPPLPITAYGLTRFACREAVFVGGHAMQDKNQRDGCTGAICVLTPSSTGPASPAAGHGPPPSGQIPKKKRSGQVSSPRSRNPQLSFDGGEEVGYAIRVAAPALGRWGPRDAAPCSLHSSRRIAVIPAHAAHLRHEAAGLGRIKDVGHGALWAPARNCSRSAGVNMRFLSHSFCSEDRL